MGGASKMKPEDRRAMGRRIRAARMMRGMKQTESAAELGLSQGSLSQYELGKSEPKASVLWQMSRLFGVSADWLLGLSDEMNP